MNLSTGVIKDAALEALLNHLKNKDIYHGLLPLHRISKKDKYVDYYILDNYVFGYNYDYIFCDSPMCYNCSTITILEKCPDCGCIQTFEYIRNDILDFIFFN
jgi:hypothetical protein